MKIVFLGDGSKDVIEKRTRVVATAAALSRSPGTVTDVYESTYNYEKNLKLIKNVLNYGHTSISEHDYLVFALENVTPIIEQIIIGYRLTSFTIKSRREVDFRNVRSYVPEFKYKNGQVLKKNEELQAQFKEYTDYLFDCYSYLVDNGIPVEDARYILPYSFYSNIIMGCDAHELANMVSDLLYGKYSNITEAYELGCKLLEMINEYAPYLKNYMIKEGQKDYYTDYLKFLDSNVQDVDNKLLNQVKCLDSTPDIDKKIVLYTLISRYGISYEEAKKIIDKLEYKNKNINMKEWIINGIISNKWQRELEQVTFTFQIPISLANLTHLTRHRMHALMVPDFTRFNLENYVTPSSISEKFKDEYDEVYKRNKEIYDYFKSQGVRSEDLIYLLLSGNACNVMTTMSARTLAWISRMRCCNKAQWEIRGLVNQMVAYAKSSTQLVGAGFGPSCQVFGFCPEGKDSCKNKQHVMMPKKQ